LQNEDRRLQKTQRADRVSKQKGTPSKGKKAEGEEEEEDEESEEEEEEDAPEEELSLEDVAATAASPVDTHWHSARIDTSDFLPSLVSACEHQVYDLVQASHHMVRHEALQLMSVFLHQAVTNPIDAMATLVAALTDRHPWPLKEAIRCVQEVVGRKKEWIRFMEQRFIDGIRLSYHVQSRLSGATLDPLHRRNLGSAAAPVFDKTPAEGLSVAYCLIKKAVVSRRMFCSKLVNELMSVDGIGVFEKEADASAALQPALQVIASPVKPLVPHPSLNGRAASNGSAASPMSLHNSPAGSQQPEADFPSFVPPVFERALTEPSMFSASPSSMQSGAASDYSSPAQPRPASPIAFLAYIAGLASALNYEDDEVRAGRRRVQNSIVQ
jgi:hypothetical protein